MNLVQVETGRVLQPELQTIAKRGPAVPRFGLAGTRVHHELKIIIQITVVNGGRPKV